MKWYTHVGDFSNLLKAFIGSNYLGISFAFYQSGLGVSTCITFEDSMSGLGVSTCITFQDSMSGLGVSTCITFQDSMSGLGVSTCITFQDSISVCAKNILTNYPEQHFRRMFSI
jgi:hypothetical protein